MAEYHDSEPNKEGTDIKDDEIVDTIFNECDCDGRGRATVSNLMKFMRKEARPELDRSELNKLRFLLDPEDCDAVVTKSVFKRAMKLWAKIVNSNECIVSSELDIVDHSSPISSKMNGHYADALDLSNISSYSCGSNDPLNNSVSNEMGRLLDHVKELEYTVKRQETTIQELQNQLHNSEENYTMLQTDNEVLQHKIAILQPILKQHDAMQKECEQLKEAAPLMETEIAELKSKVQQLKREVQAHKQEVKQLEAQNLELTTKVEMNVVQIEKWQEILMVQNVKLEEVRKQCSQHEKQNEQQCKHITELEQTIADQQINIKHLQDEKESLALRLINTEDELLSAHSQLSHVSGRKMELSYDTADDDDDDDKPRSPIAGLSDQHPSIFLELQALRESPQMEASFPDLIEGVTEAVEKDDDKDTERNELNISVESSRQRCLEQRDQEIQCLYTSQQHQEIQTSPKQPEADTKSITTQTPELAVNEDEPRRKRRCFRHTDEEQEVGSSLDVIIATCKLEVNEGGPSPALCRWIRDMETLNTRRKTNLHVRPGGEDRDPPPEMTPQLKRASSMEYEKHPRPVSTSTPTPVVQESITSHVTLKQRLDKEEADCNGGIRRCMSETQVLAGVGGSSSSGSSETSSSSALVLGLAEAFPSLPDLVLQQLGLTTHASPKNDVLSDQDVESKCSALVLAFKTDKLTLASRHDRQQRQRDQAERSMSTEVLNLKAAVHNLNYLCKDSESIDILSRIQDQVDILQRSTERVSSSAESYGSVQQESRLSRAIDVMMLHVENLKRMYEKAVAELEETRKVLHENNIVMDGNVDNTDVGQPRHKRYNSLVTLVGAAGKRGRRASIAAFARPQGSTDSTKSSTSYITFGDVKSRTLPQSRRTSLSPTTSSLDNLAPGWDRSDRLHRPDGAAGNMENIEEMTEARKNSLAKLENRVTQQKSLEENNNSQSDGSVHSRLEYPDSDNDALLGDMGEDDIVVATSSQMSFMEIPHSVKTFRDFAVDLISKTHNAIMNHILPLNMDRILIHSRRCATVLLLVAALLCLVSTFIPTSAQSRHCVQYSWVSLEEMFRSYVRLRHFSPPPT